MLAEADKALKEELAIREKLKVATQQQGEAAKAAAEAEARLRQANLNLKKEELNVLKEQEQRIKGAAQSFGNLTDVEKSAAIAALQDVKAKGFEAATPEQKALIQQAGGTEFLNQQAQQAALKDDRFRQFQELMGESADLKGTRQKITDLNAEIALDIQLDSKAVADDLKEALEPALKEVKKVFKEIGDALVEQVQIGFDISNASR